MKPATYCKNCGAYIPDGKKKCLACGFPVDAPSLGGDINKVETTTFQECSPNRLSFKPFEHYTPDGRYFWNGYEINENGQVLSIPDDDENEIPMTMLDDKTFQVFKARDKYAKIVFSDDYYERTLNLANEALEKIKKLESKQKEPKPDIDLDDLMEKTFVTVKINDKVLRFYFGASPQMCVVDYEIFGRTMDGRIIGNGIKRKIDFCLIEA